LLYSVIEFFTNRSQYENSIGDIYGKSDAGGFLAATIALFCLNLLPLLAIVNLLSLHAWLKKKGLSTYEYIVEKRERQQQMKEKMNEVRLHLGSEEQKESKDHLNSSRSEDPHEKEFKKNQSDTKTKGSILEFNDEVSKGSLLVSKNRQHNIDMKDEYLESNEEAKNSLSPEAEQEMGFRITASSNWKQKDANTYSSEAVLKGADEPQNIQNEFYHNTKVYDENNSSTSIKNQNNRAKATDLHIIEDVSESKEISQRAFESFSHN